MKREISVKMDSSRKTWSFEELRSLCAAKGLPDSKIYREALEWKRWRASYHAKQYERYQKRLDKLFPPQHKRDINKWICLREASEAHVEAAAQALHSMADILAQIINKAVLRGDFKERDVSLSSAFVEKLEKKAGAHKIVAALDKLRNSAEFRYINAFVNTIKHRRLLETTYHLEYGQGKRNEKAVCFQKFEYNGDCYGFTWATDIVGLYKSRIVELICEIGNAVNEYLRRI